MYNTYYDVLQPNFGEESLKLHYMDTNSAIVTLKTKDIINDLKNLKQHFDFSNLKNCQNYIVKIMKKYWVNLTLKHLMDCGLISF